MLADGIRRRKDAVVDRSGFSNKASSLPLGLWDKSNNLTHVFTPVILQKSFYPVAAAICENLLRVGAVEIDLGHVQPRSNDTPIGNNEALASELSSTGRPENGSGDAVMI
jgi:hypothetical protein